MVTYVIEGRANTRRLKRQEHGCPVIQGAGPTPSPTRRLLYQGTSTDFPIFASLHMAFRVPGEGLIGSLSLQTTRKQQRRDNSQGLWDAITKRKEKDAKWITPNV